MIEVMRAPRQILFGPGTAALVAELCAGYGRSVLVVTDQVVLGQPAVAALIEDVRAATDRVTIFADASPDVPLSDVAAAVAVAAGGQADVTLAIGGGTAIDLAKIVGVISRYGGAPPDYYGECLVPGPTGPLIAVPTTAGTGSEVSPVSVLSDPARELKVGVSSPYLVPDVAVVDPTLALSCPPRVTAFSGADALCHAVESFTARSRPAELRELISTVFRGRNAVSDDAAPRAVTSIAAHLPTAVADGANLAAREGMAYGALCAGIAFSHAGTAFPHAAQYPIGAATKTAHGLGVGLLLPYALSAARSEAAERMRVLAGVIGIADADGDPADAFLDWLVEFLAGIGIPRTLADIGVDRSDLPGLARKTMSVTRLLRNHPGSFELEDVERILESAWSGDREQLLSAHH